MSIPKHLSNIGQYITFLLLLFVGNVDAQILIDSVTAVVNGQAITQSEIINEFRIEAITDKPLTREPTAAEKQEYLDRIIDRRFVLHAAEKLGITADDYKEQVAKQIAEVRAKFPSDAAFHRVLQEQELEIEALEKWVSDRLIYDAYFKRNFVNKVDSRYIDTLAPKYFEENKAQFIAPATVTFRSILVTAPSESSAKEKQVAKRLAEQINGRLQQGETFEKVKQSYKTDTSISFNLLTLTTETALGEIVAQLKPTERKGATSCSRRISDC